MNGTLNAQCKAAKFCKFQSRVYPEKKKQGKTT